MKIPIKQLLEKASNELDPKLLMLGSELVMLNIEDGIRGFAENLRNFMDDTGLTATQVQRVMRASYNDAREEMDMAGEDISGMDSAVEVMAEARKALAEEAKTHPSKKAAQTDRDGLQAAAKEEYEFEGQYAEQILAHWKKFLPKMYREFKKAGMLEDQAQKIGESAASQLAQLMRAGAYRHEAEEFVRDLLYPAPENGRR